MPTAAAIESACVLVGCCTELYTSFSSIMHTVALLFTPVTYGSFSDYCVTCNGAISDEIYLSQNTFNWML